MTDEIIQKLWEAKDGLAKRFGYNVRMLAAELQKRQAASDRPVIDLAAPAPGARPGSSFASRGQMRLLSPWTVSRRIEALLRRGLHLTFGDAPR